MKPKFSQNEIPDSEIPNHLIPDLTGRSENSVPAGLAHGRPVGSSPMLGALLLGICLARAIPATAQNLTCYVVPMPTVSGFQTPAPNAISELDPDGICYVAGGCSAYPLIFQPGIPALSGGAWTAIPVISPWIVFNVTVGYQGASVAPAMPLAPLPIANAARYACGTGAALTGAATPSVRVGYTPIHLNTGLRYHATSWTFNGTDYTPVDLDPTAIFNSSRAYGVVQRDDGSLLAFGAAANVGARGFLPELPLFWTLNGDGTVATGPAPLAQLAPNRDTMIFAASTRTDGGTTRTLVGSGSAPLGTIGYNSTWAAFWRDGAAPVNLNGATGLPGPARVATGNPNAGGAAYGVTQIPDPIPGIGTSDLVVGSVQKFVRASRGYSLVNQACVWTSALGGGAPFSATLLDFTGNGGSLESVARSVSVVAGTPTVVGEVRLSNDKQWHGFVATQVGGVWTPTIAASDRNSSGWTITSIKSVNSAGVMAASARAQRSSCIQGVLLIPNSVNNFPVIWPRTAPANG